MYNYALPNHFNKFDTCQKLFQWQPACVWFNKKRKRKDIFQAVVSEKKIILAKLSHHDKIEPGTQ